MVSPSQTPRGLSLWWALLAFFPTLTAAASPQPVFAADFVIGLPAWPSAQVTANIIGKTVAEHFGLDVGYEARPPLALFAGIDNGEIQVHPEVWLPNMASPVARYADERGTLMLSANHVNAWQGLCVTHQTAEDVGIDEVSDLNDSAMASAFDSDGDGKGEMWIGDSTWVSTTIERIKAHSIGYDHTMTLLEAPEEVAMAAVDVAVSIGKPIVFYCYAPHHLFKLHEIEPLKEPPYDPAGWHIVTRAEDSNWLDKSRAETAWEAASFQVGYATSLASSAPEIARFLSNIQFDPADTEFMSYAVEVDGHSPEETADLWIADNQDRIASWLK